MLDGLGHHMGGGVPEGMLAFLVLKGQDFQRAVLVQHGAQIAHLTVHPGGTGALVQAHTDALGNLGSGYARFEFLDGALQINFNHNCSTSRLIASPERGEKKEKCPIP